MKLNPVFVSVCLSVCHTWYYVCLYRGALQQPDVHQLPSRAHRRLRRRRRIGRLWRHFRSDRPDTGPARQLEALADVDRSTGHLHVQSEVRAAVSGRMARRATVVHRRRSRGFPADSWKIRRRPRGTFVCVLGPCHTRHKVEQLCRTTLLLNF